MFSYNRQETGMEVHVLAPLIDKSELREADDG